MFDNKQPSQMFLLRRQFDFERRKGKKGSRQSINWLAKLRRQMKTSLAANNKGNETTTTTTMTTVVIDTKLVNFYSNNSCNIFYKFNVLIFN